MENHFGDDRTLRWLAIARVPGAVAAGAVAHLRRVGIEAAFEDPSVARAEGRFDWEAAIRAAHGGMKAAEAEIRRASGVGATTVHVDEPEYPVALAEISDPPPVLFVRGRLEQRDARAIAVIGSRAATRYGITATRRVVPPLVSCGVTIVSGLARGIDSEAHLAALGAGGRTVGVLGTGIDVCYPRDSKRLYDRIPESGAVVSEVPPGTAAAPWVFPPRNRIISGMSKATVVIEARMRSGTAVTARLAAEQGRLVGAVPGDIDLTRSDGTNNLIVQGAFPVRSAEDVVVHAFGELFVWPGVRFPAEPPGLDRASKAVLACLSAEPMPIDALSRRVSLPIGPLLSSLTGLESAGLAKRDPSGRYARVVIPNTYG